MAFSLKAVFGMDATGVKTELKQLRKEVNDTAQKFAAIGVAAAAAAFVKFGKDAIDLARNLKDTANSLTITTEELQALQFQAEQNSVKTEQFNASLAKLRVQTIEAAQGNETMRKSFAALGLDAETLLRLPLAQQFEAVANGFANAADQGQALHAISKIFGEDTGPKMAGALRDLAQNGLPAVIEQAREAGRVMEHNTIEGLDRAADAIDDWKRRITVAVGNIIVNFRTEEGLKALGFGLLEVAARFGGKIVDALSQANDLIGAVFRGTFTGLANIFRDQLVTAAENVARALNAVLPERFEINIAGLEEFRSSGDYVGASIHQAIAKTKPTAFSEEWGDFWKEMRMEAQAAADALNEVDFKPQAKALVDSGQAIARGGSEAATSLVNAGARAGAGLAEGGAAAGRAIEGAFARWMPKVLGYGEGLEKAGANYEILKSRFDADQLAGMAQDELKEILKATRSQLAAEMQTLPPGFSGERRTPNAIGLENTVAAIERELNQRQQVFDLYRSGGFGAAITGGASSTEEAQRLLRSALEDRELMVSQTKAIQAIANGLARAGLAAPTD